MTIKIPEESTSIVEASSESAGGNIVAFPFGGARSHRIEETRRHCETLRQSVEILRESLKTLENITESVGDLRARERLQFHIAWLHDLFLLRLDQLSETDRLLQKILLRT
ncbi:hypothetical protein QA645_38435 [Bradyrhizobium sp. CIAT3101]|uniref:hypothetical protein n=1 Tax=Bradyrhizobium sp. CIAT3101 TaxID=439387 RepID=UPI0024B262CA|nr:hypothetical protein [Bradyrhizobium sp. CIAT3101]WFU80316.1 hypothetical protein QA645_38435 [Bradyrhizobium sp. CIAT3101]